MHICLVGVEYPLDTDFGGISTYQKRLANTLISFGNKVTVICGTEKQERDYYEDGIHVIRLYTSRSLETTDSFIQYRKRIKEKILEINEQEKIDIIETPEFSGEIVEFLKNRNIPVVVKLHTSYKIWSDLNNSKLKNGLSKKIELFENLTMKYADKLICCSQVLKDQIPMYHEEINKSDIEVVPNPANVIDFYPTKKNHNSNIILYCGSFEKRKGVFQLAKAIPIICSTLEEDLKFQIIGTYFENDKKKFLKEIPIKYHKNIEFLGHIDNKELNRYFNQARIGVIPSLFDNLPYVAMEELLTELPIVASKNTGIREMIKNEESGILYDPNDYIALAQGVIKLYKDKKLAERCGKQGRKEILSKYSPEVIAKKNIQIYNQVIKKFKNFQNRKLHVCLTNFEYPTETSLGGIAIYQKRMADALYNAGCKVTVVCGSFNDYKNYYEDGVHVYRIPKNFPYKNLDDYYSYRKQLAKKIMEINEFEKIDIIESPEISAELIEFFKKKLIPVVTKLHTSYTMVKKLNDVSMFPDDIEKIIYKDENTILNKSDKIICCSQILKELIPTYHSKTMIDDIEVIPNPANVIDFYPTKKNHNSNIILYCGNFTKRKGVFQFAKAIPIICSTLEENVKFQIIGSYDGVEQTGCSLKEKFLKEIPIKYHKNIEFLGHIDNKELNKYFNQARIGVIPSLFDNLPYVAMEELLTELPIVASNNTGIREMIKNEESGILYDPNDYVALAQGVIKLYKDKKLAEKCGKQGRKEILSKYSPEVIAKKNIQIYNQVIIEFNNKHILKKVCKKYDIKILGKFKNGSANIVRKCLYNNQECVLKIYHCSKSYNFDLMRNVLNRNDHYTKVLFYDKYLDYDIYLFSYIKGQHIHTYSNEQLNNLFELIGQFKVFQFHQKLKEQNIFIKYNKYKKYLISHINNSDDVLKKLLEYDKKYVSRIPLNNNCFVHGDLAFENIIWKSNIPYLIDFDECCFAPQEYEYASFLVKSCFNNNHFDICLAKKIIKTAKLYNINIKMLENNYYFYILKVIFEKLYYHEFLGLDLESENQKKDYWLWWYALLINKDIKNFLFK